jgi:hypothetical protein
MSARQRKASRTAITTLSKWFTSYCSLLPDDSTSLARTLVTLKYITSVDALYDAMKSNPDMLGVELNQPNAYCLQIMTALISHTKNVFLNTLTTEQVCTLLDHHGMPNMKSVVIDNELSGETTFRLHLLYSVSSISLK